jgi:hypothetical protein
MTRLSRIASAFAFAALAGCATTGPSGSLRQVADQVEAARTASGNKDFSKIPPLAASVPTLDAIIAAKSDESLTAAAHYYRGEIASLTNQQNFRERHAFDPALAQEAVTEYGDTLILWPEYAGMENLSSRCRVSEGERCLCWRLL